MEEFQIWQIWSSNRIGSGLVGIGSILAVWLSMRIALNTRNNPETNLLTKIVSSAFGLVVLSFGWIQSTTVANTWIAASRSLSELKASGTEISSTADGYIARHSNEIVSWSLDLHLFKKQTMGFPVIMGSNTKKTLNIDLSGRHYR